MEFLSRINKSNSAQELHDLIIADQQEMFDYFSLINHTELAKHKQSFKQLLLKFPIVSELNYTHATSEAFVNLILNTAIRLGDMAVFGRYYTILKRKSLNISSFIQASSFFMTKIQTIGDLQSNYKNIIDSLEDAYRRESDNNKDSISAIINYYAICVEHFAQFAKNEVETIRDLILESYQDSKISFLVDSVISKVCNVSLNWDDHPYERIHEVLDNFLGRVESITHPTKEEFLIESSGTYFDAVHATGKSFDDILDINRSFYLPNSNDTVFRSLHRGVKVLEEEMQLFCYMYAYGKMHRKKLVSALKFLPELSASHQVVDWGCGQGIGSLLYLEYLKRKNNQNLCELVTLIEPSKIAISRAALHLQGQAQKIRTINKEFDDISQKEIINSSTTVHIFSNILDVELFSLKDLVNLITSKYKGTNYFIISSPFINTTRSARIDAFANYFQSNSYQYEEYANIREAKGEWINNWSRIIRLFRAVIQ